VPFAAEFDSAVKGIAWPAIPQPAQAATMALCAQLDISQWWPADKLAAMQLAQADKLLQHAVTTVPYYASRLQRRYDPRRPLDWTHFRRLPILSRGDIQTEFAALHTKRMPDDHGQVKVARTSGSTGSPIAVLETGFMRALFAAMHLRSCVWQQMNFSAAVASIRVLHGEARQETAAGWVDGIRTGPAYAMDVRTTIDEQISWLEQHRPAYLMTLPSNLDACLKRLAALNKRLEFIEQVHTYGEIVDDDLRALCHSVLDLPIVDTYSANELGVLALQAPGSSAFHTADETHIIEVLDEDEQPCQPGAVGRVVVTPLHNFASPLIRYANGDYAEVGEPLGSGRGLGVLNRIIGRTRNMAVRPGGERFWPAYGGPSINRIAPLQQVQLIQHTETTIEVRAVAAEPVTAAQETQLVTFLQDRLAYPYEISFTYVDAIERGHGQKYEEFICRVGAPAPAGP
jgi:phenylacetate-CoA ligase